MKEKFTCYAGENFMKNIILLTLASTILLLPGSCKKSPSGAAIEGTVYFVVGNVFLNGHQAAKDETVRPGDVIETKNSSTCEIIVAGKNILLVAPDSRLVYKLREGDGRLELTRGGLGALLRNKLPFGEFAVSTKTVTASIRGTAFFMSAETDDRTYACVCNGRIRFNPGETGKDVTVAASHHKAYYYTKKKGAVEIEEAGLKYLSDAAMD
jgi:ferric-dicitrate binding protein FerR (iron transport regulator)